MTDQPIAAAVGLTEAQANALAAITAFVGRHGAMPSRTQLAAELGCGHNNAQQMITRLIERGHLSTATPGGLLAGFGRDGVLVSVPAHVAARAITLHLDQVEGFVTTAAVDETTEIGRPQ